MFFSHLVSTFDIGDMAKFTRLNRNGHLHEKGKEEKTCRPNAEGDHELQEIWNIDVNLAKGICNESGNNEPRPFFNPNTYDNEKTAKIKGDEPFSCCRNQEEDECDDVHRHRCPNPGHELIVAGAA